MSRNESKRGGSEKTSKKGNSKKSVLAEPIPEQQRLVKERELVDSLNKENIHKYLQSLEQNSYSDVVASRAINGSLSSIDWQFRHGLIHMPDEPLPLPFPVSHAPKLTYSELKEQEIKAKREELQKKIDYLQEQLKNSDNNKSHEGLNVNVKDILSKEEHEQKIREIIAEKMELKKRHEQLIEENSRKKKEMEEKQQQLRSFEIEKEKERKRSCIELNMKKRKEDHDKFLQMDKQLQKNIKVIKRDDRLYQKMEQKYYSEVMLPSLEEKKNKLKQLREFHKNYELEAIKQHEKKYLLKQEERAKERLLENSQTKQPHYHPPPRSDKLNKLLIEEAQLLKIKINSRKDRNQDMQKRRQLFERQILSKHKPKVDEQKKNEILQRYIDEDRKNQRLSVDGRKLGENYLQIAKKMRRSQSHRNEHDSEKEMRLKGEENEKKNNTQMELSRAHPRDQDFYEKLRRKRIEDILNSEENSSKDKYHLLKLESEKITEKIKQKEQFARLGSSEEAQQEAAELLLSSIKAKMGIMNVLKAQPANEIK